MTEHTTTVIINLFRRLFARYQECFEDFHPMLKASLLEVFSLLHKVRENRSEGHDHSFFPPSLIDNSVRDRVENINRPLLQVNLQTHPVLVTLHDEKNLNTSKNSLMKNI